MQKETYFNFPVALMQGVLAGQKTVQSFLSDAVEFHIYSHSVSIADLNEYEETDLQRFKRSASYWEVSFGNIELAMQKGSELFQKYGEGAALVGINKEMFWDFYKGTKSSFQVECLIMFLAMRSILGKKKVVKTNNALLIIRMSGFKSAAESFPEELFAINRYQLDKIKTELQTNWNLKYYSFYTRGFYITFDMTLKELITYAEGKKLSVKEEILKAEKKYLRDSIRNSLK